MRPYLFLLTLLAPKVPIVLRDTIRRVRTSRLVQHTSSEISLNTETASQVASPQQISSKPISAVLHRRGLPNQRRRPPRLHGAITRVDLNHDVSVSNNKEIEANKRTLPKNEGNPLSVSHQHVLQRRSPVVSPTPSRNLISALGPLGEIYATPRLHQNKLDLSHHDPMLVSSKGRRKTEVSSVPDGNGESLDTNPAAKMNRLLADYLRNTRGGMGLKIWTSDASDEQALMERQLLYLLSNDSVMQLRKYGYDFMDLDFWGWILTAKSVDLAALRLWTLTNSPTVTTPRYIPDFVFRMLLRRQDWNVGSLKLMITYVWLLMRDPKLQSAASKLSSPVESSSDPTKAMVIFVRLLRHARKVYPEAIPSISALLVHHLSWTSRERRTKPLRDTAVARLSFLYNSALSLLSVPASIKPFISIVYQQRAQFRLLRSMDEFEPPLAVDREGYRAVTRVQLAHKKTIQERDWASLKAKSWPPWKEDKLGLDVEKGPEYGVSRAGQSMRRALEAGYANRQWDEVAGILAGWDTDGSPTIQTRTLLAAPIMSRRGSPGKGTLKPPWQTSIWAARIRATRTIDEAWACFLTYLDDSVPLSQDVYCAMFEKLVFEEQRLSMTNRSLSGVDDNENESVLPGDSPRVYEKPSPREAIYVRTTPPDPNGFFELMLKAGIRPSGRFLAFMLRYASTFQSGIWYLKESALPPRVVYALLSRDNFETSRLLTDIRYITDHTFAAFIHFLCRFSPRQKDRGLPTLKIPVKYSQPAQAPLRTQHINPLLQAYRLLLARRPFYRPSWNSLLAALARSGTVIDPTAEFSNLAQDISAWNHVRTILQEMTTTGIELDFAGFKSLCVGFEKGIFAAAKVLDASKNEKIENHTIQDAKQLLSDGLPLLKNIFRRLTSNYIPSRSQPFVGTSPPHSVLEAAELLPKLLEVPNPAQLHAFIRVLGLREDYSGIHTLIEWMSHFAPELQVVVDEAMYGERNVRRCLVAARVFIEQSWATVPPREDTVSEQGSVDEPEYSNLEEAAATTDSLAVDSDAAAKRALQGIFEIIQKQEDWGGWPTDEEVKAYCGKSFRE